MKYVDLSFSEPAANLACEEAMLDLCEAGGEEVLRFWESPSLFVVVGHGNRVAGEVKVEECRNAGVPILRRCSGGGTVLQGPGCLNYALILNIQRSPELHSITGTNRFILEEHRRLLASHLQLPIQIQGHTDLTLHNRKFSGNAQRRRRHCLLFHGTFLLHFDLPLITRFLNPPSLQPHYREKRGHSEFLLNLPLAPAAWKSILQNHWQAGHAMTQIPEPQIQKLLDSRYRLTSWNEKF